MSSLAQVLTGRHVACSPLSPYLLRADQHEHDLELWLRGAIGTVARRLTPRQRLNAMVRQINAIEPEVQPLTDAQLQARYRTLGAQMNREGMIDALQIQMFALLREAARRSLGKRPYDVQLLGGLIMLRGMVAEMSTGEGKTLVATLPACTAAAVGAHVHVVTVNDYLASRDAQIMQPLYAFLGLEVASVIADTSAQARRQAYACPICYVSNKELVFDYLKDVISLRGHASTLHRHVQNAYGSPQLLTSLRGLHVALVDEADSVFIDEARTPLIISAQREGDGLRKTCQQALDFAQTMQAHIDFKLGSDRQIDLTPHGMLRAEQTLAPLGEVWGARLWREQLLSQALSAIWLFKRDQHYILADGKVQIVDESTGRVMADRSWEHGLHQMIETKEGCALTHARETLSRITYQRFFGKYLLLAGMTGTAHEVAPELWQIYGLKVVKVPTHRPVQRRFLGVRASLVSAHRWLAVCDEVKAVQRAVQVGANGAGCVRPILIGTRSVEASEQLSAVFTQQGIAHVVLNARQDAQEADIVAAAGAPGQVTIATNMAGRGTDILLSDDVRQAGGLHVILTEYHDTPRVDRQLFGRSGRQGDPGATVAVVSLDNELYAQHAPRLQTWLKQLWPLLGTWWRNQAVRGLTWHAQQVAARNHRRTRMQTWQQDRRNKDQLAFSGEGKEGW